jgi:hypothetical protein
MATTRLRLPLRSDFSSKPRERIDPTREFIVNGEQAKVETGDHVLMRVELVDLGFRTLSGVGTGVRPYIVFHTSHGIEDTLMGIGDSETLVDFAIGQDS